MAELFIAPGVRVPQEAVTLSAVRSGGPGGQHVNKVSSKVELRLAICAIEGLDEDAKSRLQALAGRRITLDGVLVLTSSESRSQFFNRQEVERKLVELIQQALVPPKPRRATKATKASRERRLVAKKNTGSKKQGRGSFKEDE